MDKHRFWRGARRGLRWLAAIATGLTVASTSVWFGIQRGGNLHTVDPGVFYRSAQLSGPDLQRVLSGKGIKTVLNLRGPNSGKPWYDEEIRKVREAGIQHLDIPLSAYQDLSFKQMQDLVQMIQAAPKPILVHCKSGADRTGLVSALYRVSQGQPLDFALHELSPQYGHFPMLVPRSAAMDRNLALYVRERARAANDPQWLAGESPSSGPSR